MCRDNRGHHVVSARLEREQAGNVAVSMREVLCECTRRSHADCTVAPFNANLVSSICSCKSRRLTSIQTQKSKQHSRIVNGGCWCRRINLPLCFCFNLFSHCKDIQRFRIYDRMALQKFDYYFYYYHHRSVIILCSDIMIKVQRRTYMNLYECHQTVLYRCCFLLLVRTMPACK